MKAHELYRQKQAFFAYCIRNNISPSRAWTLEIWEAYEKMRADDYGTGEIVRELAKRFHLSPRSIWNVLSDMRRELKE